MKYKFFWGGIFSNWFICDFKINNKHFNCVEQYMMYEKAIIFKDVASVDKIMRENSPKIQKQLGREVSNFDSIIWDIHKYSIVKKGVTAKFSQNDYLKKELLKHRNYNFVEASPYDKVWGIGYSSELAIKNIDNWGENLLGKILNEVLKDFTTKN